MILIERFFGGHPSDHPIYESEEEAIEAGRDPIPWQECHEGDWGITDDGYVTECRKRQVYADSDGREAAFLTFTVGRVWANGSSSFHAQGFLDKGVHWGTTPKTWAEHEASLKRTKQVVELAARLLLAKGRLSDEDCDHLGRLYRPDQAIPRASFKRLIKQSEIQDMLYDKMVTLLNKQGLTFDYILAEYKDLIEDNKTKCSTKKSALKDMLDLHTSGSQTTTRTEEVSIEQLFGGETRRIEARKKEITSGDE